MKHASARKDFYELVTEFFHLLTNMTRIRGKISLDYLFKIKKHVDFKIRGYSNFSFVAKLGPSFV